ncbi:hypothetical protein IMY05_C1869000300 [Salix suchowensis]|nr:hypothetical protein IMY05_C1869000300 [Salix suchowensis]
MVGDLPNVPREPYRLVPGAGHGRELRYGLPTALPGIGERWERLRVMSCVYVRPADIERRWEESLIVGVRYSDSSPRTWMEMPCRASPKRIGIVGGQKTTSSASEWAGAGRRTSSRGAQQPLARPRRSPPLPKLEGVTFGWDGEDWMFCSDFRGGWLAARSLKVVVPFSAKLEPRKRFCRSSSSSSKAGCGLRFCCIVPNQQNELVSKGKRGVRRQRLEMKIEFPIESWGIGIRPTTDSYISDPQIEVFNTSATHHGPLRELKLSLLSLNLVQYCRI